MCALCPKIEFNPATAQHYSSWGSLANMDLYSCMSYKSMASMKIMTLHMHTHTHTYTHIHVTHICLRTGIHFSIHTSFLECNDYIFRKEDDVYNDSSILQCCSEIQLLCILPLSQQPDALFLLVFLFSTTFPITCTHLSRIPVPCHVILFLF